MALSPRKFKRTIFLPLSPRKLRSGKVYFGDDGRPSGDRSYNGLELSSDPSNDSPSESDQYENLSEIENSSDYNVGDENSESDSGHDASDNQRIHQETVYIVQVLKLANGRNKIVCVLWLGGRSGRPPNSMLVIFGFSIV